MKMEFKRYDQEQEIESLRKVLLIGITLIHFYKIEKIKNKKKHSLKTKREHISRILFNIRMS